MAELKVHKAELPLTTRSMPMLGFRPPIMPGWYYDAECGRHIPGRRLRKRWRGVTCRACLWRRKGI